MAFLGFFGNYNKPGPGVEKDEPQKAAPIRFFEVLFRKFGKMVQLNLLFLVPFIVALALMFLVMLFPTHFSITLANGIIIDLWNLYVVPIPLILISPFEAGLTYITRNFAREEHAFIFSDFKDAVKNNYKYFLINGVVRYLAYVLITFSFLFYYTNSATNNLFLIPLGLCLLLALLFVFSQFYVPIMIVMFDLKLKQIYKNSFIFSLAGLLRNFLLLIIFAAIIVLLYCSQIMGLTMLIALIFIVCLLFSFSSYLVNFTIYPLIKKFMISPLTEKPVEKNETEPEKDPMLEDFSEDLDDDEDGYAYVNGKLVKKSEIK